MRRAALLAVLALLGACAHKRVAGPTCMFKPLKLAVLDEPASVEAAGAGGFRRAVDAAVRGYYDRGRSIEAGTARPPIPEHLVLSGGGKWGAFGAGFLHALPGRPKYQVVTGVSTGALQSTFVFLGDQPVAIDRKSYRAELDLALAPDAPRPDSPAGRRYIDDLPLAYTIARSESVLNVLGSELTALRKGSAGDLTPLRARLDALIDTRTMELIAEARTKDGRGLFVGVVDMDDGQAYAIDLTQVAVSGMGDPGRMETARQCYIEALVASSSEPLVAFPVFIRTQPNEKSFQSRMYLDGGLRDGLFLEEVLRPDGGGRAGTPTGPVALPFNTTVIVNGELRSKDLTTEPDKPWASKWSLLSVVMRTKDMLVDQIYQFSVDRVRDFGSANGTVQLALARGHDDHEFAGKTCAAWRRQDTAPGFPPNFMKCLIDYGRARALQKNNLPRWDLTSMETGRGARRPEPVTPR